VNRLPTILLFLAMTAAVPPRACRAAADDASPQKLDEAARQLGDADAGVREAAAATLRGAGADAEPALRAAAEGGDPEAARRARALLRELRQQPAPADPPLP
jgi:hypothetical protein